MYKVLQVMKEEDGMTETMVTHTSLWEDVSSLMLPVQGTHQICLEVEEPEGTGCFTTECTTVNVYAIPTGNFAVEPKICVTDVANPVVISAPSGSGSPGTLVMQM
ncbi:MAG: hypothetical protein R2784_04800 [Saprospiraceae bacterium]